MTVSSFPLSVMHEDGHGANGCPNSERNRTPRKVIIQPPSPVNLMLGLDYLVRNVMRTTRRTFLSAAGAAGLGAAYVDSASAKIEPEPWGIKLGIATYTYRKFER